MSEAWLVLVREGDSFDLEGLLCLLSGDFPCLVGTLVITVLVVEEGRFNLTGDDCSGLFGSWLMGFWRAGEDGFGEQGG